MNSVERSKCSKECQERGGSLLTYLSPAAKHGETCLTLSVCRMLFGGLVSRYRHFSLTTAASSGCLE